MIQPSQRVDRPAYQYSDTFFDQYIALPDGTTVTVRDATPQQFDAYVKSIISQIKTRPSVRGSLYRRLRLNVDWQTWPEESRWYVINTMAIYRLVKEQGIALFAESESVR